MKNNRNLVHVIGGGLAGSETAWQLARAGVPVAPHEMRPVRGTEAHLSARSPTSAPGSARGRRRPNNTKRAAKPQ